jgi:hypothetical protein
MLSNPCSRLEREPLFRFHPKIIGNRAYCAAWLCLRLFSALRRLFPLRADLHGFPSLNLPEQSFLRDWAARIMIGGFSFAQTSFL